jgi:hypothetical protein
MDPKGHVSPGVDIVHGTLTQKKALVGSECRVSPVAADVQGHLPRHPHTDDAATYSVKSRVRRQLEHLITASLGQLLMTPLLTLLIIL